jgi:excisionase family DNA binding protein
MNERAVLLTVKKAAALLGVCPNTIRTWGAAGKIPEHRHPINNYRLYKRQDVEALLAAIVRPVEKQG